MCIATPISVNTFLIDVSYSRATFSLEMLGSEHAIEDREITSRWEQAIEDSHIKVEFAGLRVH